MSLLETTISGRKRRGNHAHVVAELGRGIVSARSRKAHFFRAMPSFPPVSASPAPSCANP